MYTDRRSRPNVTMLPADCSAVSPGPGARPSRLEKFLRVLSVVTMLMTVPQVWAVWSSTKAVGVSPLSWAAYLFFACLWFHLRDPEARQDDLPGVPRIVLDAAIVVGALWSR